MRPTSSSSYAAPRWTSTRLAAEGNLATSTVCAVLVRLGLNRLCRLEPPEPPTRYRRRHPGEFIHSDIKTLGRFHRRGHRATGTGTRNRGAGGDDVHVPVDGTSRLASGEILDNERGLTCAGFLRRSVAWFADQGIQVQRAMTHNGAGYGCKVHATALAELDIRRPRPQAPQPPHQAD